MISFHGSDNDIRCVTIMTDGLALSSLSCTQLLYISNIQSVVAIVLLITQLGMGTVHPNDIFFCNIML